MAIDLEYESTSNNSKSGMSAIDRMTRFLVLVANSNKSAATSARVLVERVCSVFSAPETSHSEKRSEFQNELVKELQSVVGFKKTRTSAYPPPGNSVLERVHVHCTTCWRHTPTLNTTIGPNHCRLFSNRAYKKTHEETPRVLIFGREASLPVDVILGVPCTTGSGARL